MAEVTGIGGVFFRARDPETMAAWYMEHLGVGMGPEGPWMQAPGPTVFIPFPAETEYFGRADQAFMVNFRVSDLDGLVARLEGAGIAAERRDEWDSEIGRFARIHDPEGNPIELWEPRGPAA